MDAARGPVTSLTVPPPRPHAAREEAEESRMVCQWLAALGTVIDGGFA